MLDVNFYNNYYSNVTAKTIETSVKNKNDKESLRKRLETRIIHTLNELQEERQNRIKSKSFLRSQEPDPEQLDILM